MQYLRGRYYSPEIRRFISEDPAKDGLNWYAYCGNNPVMFVDPWGYGPGGEFDSMNAAIIDFGLYINAQSIEENVEYASLIYSYERTVLENHNNKGVIYDKTIYSYTDPYTSGQYNSVDIGDPQKYIEDNA